MKRLLSTAPLLLAACGAPDPLPAVPDPAAAVVPAAADAPIERPDFPGVITARRSQVIAAEFAGRIEQVFVHQRKRVKAGEIVAKLDPRELQAEADQLRAQEQSAAAQAGSYAASARAAANQAKTERRLYERGFQSRNATISANARLAEARAQIGAAAEQARASRVRRIQLEEQIAKANLPAPIDGVITIVKAKDGEIVQRGVPIARVFDDSDLIIKFALPKEHRHLVELGGRVELRVDGLAQPVWADIERIADEEPPITFAVVEANIDDSKLRPGEIQVAAQGRVRIVEPPKPRAPSSPPTAPVPASPQPQPQPAPAGANR